MKGGGGGGAPSFSGGGMKGDGGGAPVLSGGAKGGSFGGPSGRRYSGAYQNGGTYYGKHGHRHHHRRFANGVPFFGFNDGYYDNYAYYDDCYEVRRVRTSYGLRWRRVYVCDY